MTPDLSPFETLLTTGGDPETVLNGVVALTGTSLAADRCFLYVRQPGAGRGRIAFCWRRHAGIPDVIQPDWQEDTTDLPAEDPLFRAALATEPSRYVDDVETAPPTLLNRDFEHRTFGHRALIHAHVTESGTLWGILQPCVFGSPRPWTESDRMLIEPLLPRLLPFIQAYTR